MAALNCGRRTMRHPAADYSELETDRSRCVQQPRSGVRGCESCEV